MGLKLALAAVVILCCALAGYRDVTYDLFHYKIYSHRTLDGRNILQFYREHCSEITPCCWLKLFHKHEVEIVPCKIRNDKVFYD